MMPQKKFLSPMLIIAVLFFIFGFVSWLNAILIPYFKLALQLSLNEAMMVTFAFYISYFVMALPSSYLLQKTGYKNGMMLGLFCMACGALLFLPAAHFSSYALFLTGLFVQATGLTVLQTSSNPYVTILGPLESAARRMSLMGVCNKAAGAIAPLIFLNVVTKSGSEVDDITKRLPSLLPAQAEEIFRELIFRLQTPYGVMAAVLFLMAIAIYFSGLPDIKAPEKLYAHKENVLHFPHLMLGVVAVFCGVSVEVLAVDSIIGYAQFQGYPFLEARYFATYTLLIMIAGYLVGIIAIPRWLDQRKALIICAATGIALTVMILTSTASWSVWNVALLGFCNALIWPAIWPLALKDLNSFTERGSAFLIMGITGGAVTPLLFSRIASRFDQQWAYLILLPFYLYLLYYGSAGYRIRKMKPAFGG